MLRGHTSYTRQIELREKAKAVSILSRELLGRLGRGLPRLKAYS